MDHRKPKVSIGLPVYNGERFLAGALNSLISQDYEDFEIVISDNASTDNTGNICQEYAQKDDRIRYSRNERNIGLSRNHNRVFALSQGEFFKWAAHDDEYPKRMLSRFVEVLQDAPPSVSVVYSPCQYIDEFGNTLQTISDRAEKKDKWPHKRLAHLIVHISVYNCAYGLIRSDILRKTRLQGSFPIADRVLFAELAMLGEIWEVKEPLLRIRLHSGRSFVAHTTPQALRELFDPVNGRKGSLLSLEGRVQLELLRSACLIPPRLIDKILCLAAALTMPSWRKFKNFGGRQKRRLSELIASRAHAV